MASLPKVVQLLQGRAKIRQWIRHEDPGTTEGRRWPPTGSPTPPGSRFVVRRMHLNSRPLAGRWAVVTGSSRGIGRAIALRLADAGACVAIHGRDAAALASTAEAVRKRNVEADVIVAPLEDRAGRQRLLSAAFANREIEWWVNNAGADVLTGDAAQWSFADKLAALWRVDVEATIDLSRAAGQRMRQLGRGSIINIGWDQAETGMEGDSGEMFAATKGAVMAFTRSLACSLAPQVRVNCVAPGWIRTAWGTTASDAWQQRAVRESLRGRWGTPADVAAAVLWLASPEADFIHGETIRVNGGFRHASHAP